jgi:hypothetical protein
MGFQQTKPVVATQVQVAVSFSVEEVTELWEYFEHLRSIKDSPPPFNRPEQLLFALYYLKVYPTWDQMTLTTGITEKTLRKWGSHRRGVLVQH